MTARPLAILGTGLVTPVGATAPASCSAFRAKLTNPQATPYIDSNGAWIMAHQLDIAPPCSGLTRLCRMACWAIEEALQPLDRALWRELPLLLCVAETDRPGRQEGLDDRLLAMIQQELGTPFAPGSAVVPHGRVSAAVAIAQARKLIESASGRGVLVVGVDSLVSWPTMSHYERADRLLTEANSDGFMPGEAAGALWLGPPSKSGPQLLCTGIGFSKERAHLDSETPSRADGLTQAIRSCLEEAGRALQAFDFRITDLSGETYYFREASLALTRLSREGQDDFDLWHPAECTGECGAAAGLTVIAAADHATRQGYAPGGKVLAHWSNDAGQRAAITLEVGEPA